MYKHAQLALPAFTQNFIQPVLDKLSFENKNIVPLGDFKIDFLHYENDNQARIFLDYMYSISQSPQITMPTRITPHYKTLIDIIFKHSVDESSISGMVVYPEFETKNNRKQVTIYKRNYSKDNLSNLKMNFKT